MEMDVSRSALFDALRYNDNPMTLSQIAKAMDVADSDKNRKVMTTFLNDAIDIGTVAMDVKDDTNLYTLKFKYI